MPFHLGRPILLLLAFFTYHLQAATFASSMIPLIHCRASDISERLNDIDLVITKPFLVSEITFDCDVMCSLHELSYLIGIQKGQEVNAQDLKNGIFYLSQKNKFESITLYLIDDGDAKNLHIVLKSWWTFVKVRCKGILLGKETILRDYLIQPGDRFDPAKHIHSLMRIKSSLKGQGYFKPTITSEFIKNAQTKSVEVILRINKGEKFTVKQSSVTIEGQITDSDKKNLISKIHANFFKPLVNSIYDKSSINRQCGELKEYLEKKGYPHIAIDLKEQIHVKQATIDLIWTVDLFQKKEFVFFGNHHFSKQQLLDEILLFGRSAWLLPAHMLAHELVNKYHQKGYCSVSIDTKEESDRSFFLVNEGPRFAIKEIIFDGVDSFEHQQLIKKFFSPVLKSHYFDEALLKKCLDELIVFYLSSGYWEIKAQDYQIIPLSGSSGTAQVKIKVQEGPCIHLNSVSIVPFTHLENKCPFTVRNGLESAPFNFYHLKEQRSWIIASLEKEGYTAITPSPEIKRSGNMVDVIWHVSVAQKNRTFGKTILQGSSSFPYEYIMRELSFVQGQTVDPQKIRATHQRLKQLELFDSIQVTQGRSPFSDIEQPILIKTMKDDPFELRLRGGMGLLQLNKQYTFAGITYKAGGSFLWKNPFNYADQMRFDADFSWSERFIAAQYCRPWLWNIPARWIIELYDMHYKQPGILQNQKSLYELTQQGFLISLNRRWPFVETAGSMGIEWMETNVSEKLCGYDVNPAVARALNFEPCLVDRKIPFIYCEPTIFVDCLDNKVQPTRGSLTLATIKGMFPLKSMDIQTYFVKVQFEQSLYIPIFPCVVAVRFRVGHIFHQHLSSIMPSERFYLGGANSIRSYQTDMAPPLGELVDLNSKKRFVPQGGKSMFNINTEIRFPVYGSLGGVVFQDLGALSSNRLADITSKDVVAGTGFGLRYNTPIGPLRFDIAWKWNRGDKDIASYAWFITFGNAF